MSKGRYVLWQVLTNSHRFGLFFLGSGLSNIGTWCQNLAGILLVYRISESTLVVGLVTVAQFAWPIVLAPWAGGLADRVDRRAIIIGTQIGGAAVSTLLAVATFTDTINIVVALVGISLLGIMMSFQSPAQLALVPLMVSKEHLEFGLSLGSTQFNIARAVGPMLAAGLIAVWGIGAAFLFNAMSFLAYIVALRLVRPAPQSTPARHTRMSDALRIVTSSRLILPLFAVAFVINGASDIVTTLGPARSVELSGGDGWTGWFVTAFGIGAILGALVVIPLVGGLRRRLPLMLAVQALAATLFALAREPWVAIVGAALFGIGFMVCSNRTLSIVQRRVPHEVLGRVTALWLVAFLGGRVVYALAGGALADAAGPTLVAVLAAVTLAVASVGSLFITEHRRGDGPALGSPGSVPV